MTCTLNAEVPPAYIEVGQLDIFRDEDIRYALTLSRAGVPIAVHATELTGAERDEKYRIQSERYPGFAAYQQKASRTIPVIALTRRDARAPDAGT
jgi:acetyl esterase/lipase